MAGGAPLYLSNWAIFGGVQPNVTVDQWAIDNAGHPASHLRPFPADGTLLGSSDGGVFIAAGGAPLYLSNWDAIGGPRPVTTIDSWDVSHAGVNPAAHLRPYPADGSLISSTSDGRVYVVAGGAPLYLSNWDAIGGARPATAIDQWDIDNSANPLAHLRQYPADGTFVRASSGRVYRVAGGAPIYVSSWSVFGGEQPAVAIDQWAIDNSADPHAHLRGFPADGTVVRGLPSTSLWSFTGGLRTSTASGPNEVAVDDVGLAAFGIASLPATAAATTPPTFVKPPRKRCRRGSRRSGRCRGHRHRARRHKRHRQQKPG